MRFGWVATRYRGDPMPGMPLTDAADADELAAVRAELGRYSFLFAAPPRIHGLTGVPVNPVAIF